MDTDCDLFTDVDLVCYQFAAGYEVFVRCFVCLPFIFDLFAIGRNMV